MSGPLALLSSLSQQLGGDAAEICALFSKAFAAQQALLRIVPQTQKPGDKILSELFDGTMKAIAAVQQFKESHTKTPQPNLLAAVSEAVNTLSWISVVRVHMHVHISLVFDGLDF